jgi:hypothetical protein
VLCFSRATKCRNTGGAGSPSYETATWCRMYESCNCCMFQAICCYITTVLRRFVSSRVAYASMLDLLDRKLCFGWKWQLDTLLSTSSTPVDSLVDTVVKLKIFLLQKICLFIFFRASSLLDSVPRKKAHNSF